MGVAFGFETYLTDHCSYQKQKKDKKNKSKSDTSSRLGTGG